MLDDLTIIIPTHNRYAYLKRLLKYLISYNIKNEILILDSSENKVIDIELKNIFKIKQIKRVEFNSNIYFVKKLYLGTKLLKTKYAVSLLFPCILNAYPPVKFFDFEIFILRFF